MSKIFKLLFLTIICGLSINCNAQIDNDRRVSEIEYGVKQIGRICPTYMWDSWKFRDIIYEKDVNTVYFVIQLNDWEESKKAITPEKIKKQTNWIVENFIKAYQSIVSDKDLRGDGDFMLYLSVGTLLHKLAVTDTKLQFVFLKPDKDNIILKDTPLVMDGKEINEVINRE